MPVAWKEPTAEQVVALMNQLVVNRANDNSQIPQILSLRVVELRGLIGRKQTLSNNENEVPPEGLRHTLVLTIFDLINGTPNFQFVIRGPDGSESGMGYSIRQAQKWWNNVADGEPVSYPTNPQTEYPELVRSGSDDDEVDTTAA